MVPVNSPRIPGIVINFDLCAYMYKCLRLKTTIVLGVWDLNVPLLSFTVLLYGYDAYIHVFTNQVYKKNSPWSFVLPIFEAYLQIYITFDIYILENGIAYS